MDHDFPITCLASGSHLVIWDLEMMTGMYAIHPILGDIEENEWTLGQRFTLLLYREFDRTDLQMCLIK